MSDIREKYLYRSTHCWNCKHGIDTIRCNVCPRCGWIICDYCGACESGCFSDVTDMFYDDREFIRNLWVQCGKPDCKLTDFVHEHNAEYSAYRKERIEKREQERREQEREREKMEKAKQMAKFRKEQAEREAERLKSQSLEDLYSRLDIGTVLIHASYGKGFVTERHSDKNFKYFSVRFECGDRLFVCNDSFFELFEFE